jgi:predicted CXXCH cytochrome family protein
MRRVVVLAIGLILTVASQAVVHAEIAGSKHDFSTSGDPTGQGFGLSGNQICVVCHTPHHGEIGGNAPLWNHVTTQATFTPYDSPTLDSAFSEPGNQPGGISKLCLSCHDGTVAIDSFGNNTGGPMMTGSGLLDQDLSNDHPVSIIWDHEPTVGGDCSTQQCHFGTRALVFFGTDAASKTIECATCHDVHNTAGHSKLLRTSMDNSELCLICHLNKGS